MLEELTPRQIVAELDRYIIGQNAAKRAVAIALRNRYRRRMLGDDLRNEVIPKNILMIGPTGVGKTEIARRLAHLARAPFIKVEATKFTEVGYVGRDVDSMIRDLLQESVRIVEREKMEEVAEKAKSRAIDQIVDILQPKPRTRAQQVASQVTHQAESLAEAFNNLFKNGGEAGASSKAWSQPDPAPEPTEQHPDEAEIKRQEQLDRIRRQRIREQIVSGARDDEDIEIEIEDSVQMPVMHVMGGPDPGQDGGGMDMQGMLGSLMPRRHKKKKVSIKEAKEILSKEEARAMIDPDQVGREAIERAEQSGIIFVDEMDKIAGRSGDGGGRGPDVSREGVQRDILPIIEGSTVQTKLGQVRTDYMLFIAAGAFHVSKPSDLIPELQGRLPIRVELDSLTKDDFRRILTEPQNALIKQYTALLATEGVTIRLTDDAIDEIANIAAEVNTSMENIGARRLHTVMERLLEDLSFDAPDVENKTVEIDSAYVHLRLDSILKDEDLSHYIL
jgi:ATP-dependent HslUV protease ATP-binding subunit HslU